MVRALIAICLFLCPVQLLIAQDEPVHSISELTSLLQKNKTDSERVDLLLEAALVYIMRPGEEKNDLDSTLFFTNEAMNLSNRLNKPVLQARCFWVYSHLHREGDQKDKGKSYIDRAIVIFTKFDLKEYLGDAYFELQRYYNGKVFIAYY